MYRCVQICLHTNYLPALSPINSTLNFEAYHGPTVPHPEFQPALALSPHGKQIRGLGFRVWGEGRRL